MQHKKKSNSGHSGHSLGCPEPTAHAEGLAITMECKLPITPGFVSPKLALHAFPTVYSHLLGLSRGGSVLLPSLFCRFLSSLKFLERDF